MLVSVISIKKILETINKLLLAISTCQRERTILLRALMQVKTHEKMQT